MHHNAQINQSTGRDARRQPLLRALGWGDGLPAAMLGMVIAGFIPVASMAATVCTTPELCGAKGDSGMHAPPGANGPGGVGGGGSGGFGGRGEAGESVSGKSVVSSDPANTTAYGGIGGAGGDGGAGGGADEGGAGGAGGAGASATNSVLKITDGILISGYGGHAGTGGTGGAGGDGILPLGGSAGQGGDGGTADGNTITMTGGSATDLYGGYAGAGGAGGIGGDNSGSGGGAGGYGANGGNATYNTVTMTGGSATNVYGGFAGAAGGGGDSGDASGLRGTGGKAGASGLAEHNTVTVTGSVVKNVYGGYGGMGAPGGSGAPDGAGSADGAANLNTVSVANSTVTGNIVGGGGLSAVNNRVILGSSLTFNTGSSIVAGGEYRGFGSSGDLTSGNVLEVHTKGLTLKNVQNFAQYHFILPADTTAGDAIFTLTDPAGTNLGNAKVGVAMTGGGNLLKNGHEVALFHNASGVTSGGVTQLLSSQMTDGSGTLYQGVSIAYKFSLASDPEHLYAVVDSGGASGDVAAQVLDQTKAPVEGRMSGLSLTQNGGDLAAGAGIGNAVNAASGSSGFAGFGATSGSSSRYNSGSHVDVDGFSLLLGVAKRFGNTAGNLTAGAFFESGWGSFSTYNDFASGNVRGDGHAHYTGGGVLARQDFKNGLYAEGSIRGGQVSSDWASRQMQGSPYVSYDTSTPYYGLHAGVGYIYPVNAKLSLDTSAQYFWTHQNADDATIAGDPYHFEAVNSQVSRLGVRANYAFAEQFAGYAGLAWDYQFDGEARATVYGLSTPSPSVKGSTGILEVGFKVQPERAKALTLEASVQGYTGKREGVGGMLKASWLF